MSRFCIAGSINMDLVTKVPRFPKPGETISGLAFDTFTGGKGANQAVALAKLGAETSMVGRTGSDIYASQYMSYFKTLNVDTAGIEAVDTSTGIAAISVDGKGENCIIYVEGANGTVTPEYISSKTEIIAKADYLLLQLEIPMDAVCEAAKTASENGRTVILDPAPAQTVPNELLKHTTIITPNETEAEILTGIKPSSDADIEKIGKALADKGVSTVIIKAGSRGAYIYQGGNVTHVEGFKVDTVDTTAAGDTFNAGLAYALGKGKEIKDAVRFANAAAAISTTRVGAQSGMPSLNDVKALLD
jgi:ribokinase